MFNNSGQLVMWIYEVETFGSNQKYKVFSRRFTEEFKEYLNNHLQTWYTFEWIGYITLATNRIVYDGGCYKYWFDGSKTVITK